MAIAPTGAIYKSLIFDGEDSRDYGVYITGEAVYNAPERDVEMVAIPGRNGAFALDKGRFENIEVIYPAGIFADTETDFAEAISDFRNFLCSRNGYVRLEDEYNPNEYRMAIYKSGLEVSPTQLMTGEFEIIFECKPQRWLKSGETAISVTSGDELTNPTLFASSPMLEVEGYGEINVGEKTIALDSLDLGDINISNGGDLPLSPTYSFMNIGDKVRVSSIKADAQWYAEVLYRFTKFTVISSSWNAGSGSFSCTKNSAGTIMYPTVTLYPADGEYGTESDIVNGSFVVEIESKKTSDNVYYSANYSVNLVVKIDTAGNIILDTFTYSALEFPHIIGGSVTAPKGTSGEVIGTSTKSALGNPTYIDCDLGEAYKVENGEIVSLNHVIDLGSDLPTLAVGSTEITFDNTITDLKVVPRWWKV